MPVMPSLTHARTGGALGAAGTARVAALDAMIAGPPSRTATDPPCAVTRDRAP